MFKGHWTAKACLVVAAGLLASACGSSTSSSTATTSASGGKLALGSRTIGIDASNLASAAEEGWVTVASSAIKALGWKPVVVNGQGSPTLEEQAIQTFVTQHVSGIITMAIDGAPIRQQLASAKSAGIPVIAVGISVDPQGKSLFNAVYAPSDRKYAQNMASYITAHFPKGTSYVTLNLSAVYGAAETVDAINPLLTAAGYVNAGTCNMGTTTIVQDAQSCTTNLIQAHPQAKVYVSCCDFTPAITVPALTAIQKTNVLQIAPYDDAVSQQMIQKGDNLALAVSNIDTGVLIAVDQIAAHAVKGTPINPNAASTAFKYVMLDKSNVPTGSAPYFNPNTELAQFVHKWSTEYVLP